MAYEHQQSVNRKASSGILSPKPSRFVKGTADEGIPTPATTVDAKNILHELRYLLDVGTYMVQGVGFGFLRSCRILTIDGIIMTSHHLERVPTLKTP